MQGKNEVFESFYKKVINELTYFDGSLGINKIKFWSKQQNFIECYAKLYCNKTMDRMGLKNKIYAMAAEIEANLELTVEFEE